MHDPFDDQLKDRLGNYSEEPDDKLWSNISSNIESVTPQSAWIKVTIGTTAVLVAALLIFVIVQVSQDSIAPVVKQQIENKETEKQLQASDKSNDSNIIKGQHTIGESENSNQKTITERTGENNASDDQQQSSASSSTDDQHAVKNDSDKSPVKSLLSKQAGNESVANNKANGKQASALVREDGKGAGQDQRVKNETANGNNNSGKTSALNNGVNGKNSEAVISSGQGDVHSDENSIVQSANSVVLNQESSVVGGVSIQDESSSSEAKMESDPKSGVSISDRSQKEDSLKEVETIEKPVVVAENVKKKDPEKKKSEPKKLSLFVTAMPTFGYQRIESNKSDNVLVESISKTSSFSTKRLGVRLEAGLEYKLTSRVKAFGSVLYYQRKQTISYVEKFAGTPEVVTPATDEADTVVVFDPNIQTEQRSFEYELKNIGIQLGLNYVLSENKFLHVIGTGIEFHKGLSKLPKEQQELGFGKSPSTYVFYNLYYRVQYPTQGRLKAIFQPTFNYSLYLNKDMNAPFYVKPYGLGLNLGLTYNF